MIEGENICSCDLCELKTLFFESVSEEKLESLCSKKTETEFSKGELVFEVGKPITEFIYLKSGLVKLFKPGSSGKEQIITIAKPFDFVSLLSVFSDTHYNYSVSVLEDSVTCSLHLHEVKQLIRSNGDFALGIMEKMSRVSDKIILDSLSIRQHHLHGRVALILLYFADQIYYSDFYELPISRKEIAEYIGKTTENVIRTLSEFRKDKIIKIFGKSIEIVEKERLIQISEFG